MYPNLKLQIFKSGARQICVAKDLGLAGPVLSKIIHGYREPTRAERKLLAEYFGVEESWLFEVHELQSHLGTALGVKRESKTQAEK